MARKAISPVVAVVILIGLAVMTGGLLSSWVSSFITDSSRQDTCSISTMYSISDPTFDESSGEIKVKIKNTGNDAIYNFTFETDNGTDIVLIPASSPSPDLVVGSGRTQYVVSNSSYYNMTGVETVTVLTESCPGYSPTAVKVENI
jgi:flagellin-like protein